MQEEIILHREHPSQFIRHLHKSIQPKSMSELEREFDAKITPLFLQRKLLANVAMAEDSNSFSDPSNKEVNVSQEPGEEQDFLNPNLPELGAGPTREVSANSNPRSFYLGEDSDSQIQTTVSHRMVEEKKPKNPLVEHSIPAIMKRYYLQNEIDLAAWNTNPVLKKLLPVLLEDQIMTSGILLAPQRRAQELIKKIHLITLRILRGDRQLMQDVAAHAKMFEDKDFKESHRTLIVNNSKLFNRICNMSFFKLLKKKLQEETVSDIQTNLVDKFDVTDPARLEKAFESAIDADGKRMRTFKKPFTVMENLWSLILYCNEFLYELRGLGPNERRNTIQGIKDHLVDQLDSAGLRVDEAVYPVKRSKGVKGAKEPKDLYFQAFLHVV